MNYRVIVWYGGAEDDFIGYGFHRTKRLAKKAAKDLVAHIPNRGISIFGVREGYLVWHRNA